MDIHPWAVWLSRTDRVGCTELVPLLYWNALNLWNHAFWGVDLLWYVSPRQILQWLYDPGTFLDKQPTKWCDLAQRMRSNHHLLCYTMPRHSSVQSIAQGETWALLQTDHQRTKTMDKPLRQYVITVSIHSTSCTVSNSSQKDLQDWFR